MKARILALMLIGVFVISSCAVQGHRSPHRSSSARAAYGNAVLDLNPHRKQKPRKKQKPRREAKAKSARNNTSYWHARPY
jgi:hypothetical protein